MTNPNPKKPVNPWMIIGWIILAIVLLIIGSCVAMVAVVGNAMDKADSAQPAAPTASYGQPVAETPAAQPIYKVQVVGFSCSENYGRTKAEISFQNIGAYNMEFAQVLVKFGGNATKQSYLQPTEFRAGSTASATVYAPEGYSGNCAIVSVQGRDGIPAEIYGGNDQPAAK